MSWAAIAGGTIAAVGAVGGSMIAKGGSKKAGSFSPTPYSGARPDTFKNIRPVEQQVTDILMRRSLGQDVGYDPKRLALMKQNYDIDYQGELKRGKEDRQNSIAGMGLSRNLAAREALMNRYMGDMSDQRTKALNTYDINDLEAARNDKNMNTQNLQRWGEFGFNQNNSVANFDQSLWKAENGLDAQAVESQNSANAANNASDRQAMTDIASGIGGGVQTGLGIYSAKTPSYGGTTSRPATTALAKQNQNNYANLNLGSKNQALSSDMSRYYRY